eukprot:3848819-Prymnesium_polylepis.2
MASVDGTVATTGPSAARARAQGHVYVCRACHAPALAASVGPTGSRCAARTVGRVGRPCCAPHS